VRPPLRQSYTDHVGRLRSPRESVTQKSFADPLSVLQVSSLHRTLTLGQLSDKT